MSRLLVVILLGFFFSLSVFSTELSQKIKGLKSVVSVESLEVIPFFTEKYLITVRQPLNHADTTDGFFTQRVFLSHKGFANPMVMITEGYNAEYANRPSYKNELCDILEANQICIEHRFFGASVPVRTDWKYLTTKNAAADHHTINRLFKQIYTGKWIATGISKGGQTSVLYKAFYPNDVDATVPYVAPVNFGVEDGRHEPFLANVSTPDVREKIFLFQREILKRRESLRDDFIAFSAHNGFTYKASIDSVYDLCVMEYPFSFFQWGTNPDKIPAPDAPDSLLFAHFAEVASPDYFAVEGHKKYISFYVQAARELGYYGYDTEPLKEFMVMKSTENYLHNYFLQGITHPIWFETMRWADKKVRKKGNNMLFIYGEYDPWSATAYVPGKRKDQMVVVKQGGDHRTRILNLPENQKKEAIKLLKSWL